MQISPMTLGTVQLGMNYGIANKDGKPDEAVMALLHREFTNADIPAIMQVLSRPKK